MSDSDHRSWNSVAIICALTILSMGFVGTIVPLMDDLQQGLSATPEALGFAVALFSAPSALLAGIGGGLIDRVGAKTGLIIGGVLSIIADPIAYGAQSIDVLYVAFLISGTGFAAITVAGPALIMAITSGPRQFQAMSVWSTYPPAGLSLGLLIAAAFAGQADWRWALALHGVLIAISTAAAMILPKGVTEKQHDIDGHGGGLAELVTAFRDIGILRLSVAACLPAAIAYGTTLIVPAYLAQAQQLSLSTSSSIVAFSNLATILGGIVAGPILARNVSPLRLYAAAAVLGIASQSMLFLPNVGFAVALTGLIVWTFTIGAAIAVTMALLPFVARDPARGAAAAGLVGQFISAASFLVPGIYFGVLAGGNSTEFIMLAAAGLIVSLIALPVWRTGALSDARPGVAPPI